MSIRVEGIEELVNAMGEMGKTVRREGEKAIARTAQNVKRDALDSIQREPKSGRVYFRGSGGNVSGMHQASAPGEAPATDTGALVRSATAAHRELKGEVRFSARHAYWLEFGTLNMAPRPFLQPALEANTDDLKEALARGLEIAADEIRKT